MSCSNHWRYWRQYRWKFQRWRHDADKYKRHEHSNTNKYCWNEHPNSNVNKHDKRDNTSSNAWCYRITHNHSGRDGFAVNSIDRHRRYEYGNLRQLTSLYGIDARTSLRTGTDSTRYRLSHLGDGSANRLA